MFTVSENIDRPAQQRKIPRYEWPAIVERYGQGESLASIARAYSCTAPAIRYIVRREGGSGSQAATGAGHSSAPRRSAVGDGAFGGRDSRLAGWTTGGITASLRDAAMMDIAGFMVALDSVVEAGTPYNLQALRGATDRLLRAVARVRIAVEAAPETRAPEAPG